MGKIGIKEKDAVHQLSKILLDKNENICSRYHAVELLQIADSEEATTVIKQNKGTINYIYKNFSTACIIELPGVPAPPLRKGTLDHLRKKPPVMCRIPVIKNLLAWKCSK